MCEDAGFGGRDGVSGACQLGIATDSTAREDSCGAFVADIGDEDVASVHP